MQNVLLEQVGPKYIHLALQPTLRKCRKEQERKRMSTPSNIIQGTSEPVQRQYQCSTVSVTLSLGGKLATVYVSPWSMHADFVVAMCTCIQLTQSHSLQKCSTIKTVFETLVIPSCSSNMLPLLLTLTSLLQHVN